MNILHLSDIHFGRNYPCYGIPDNFTRHDEILDELIRIIADMDENLRPEHIIFTGDIAWHGKSAEYREALVWFRRLLSALGLTGRDISFCAGNHDLDLSCNCEDPDIHNDSVHQIDQYYEYRNTHRMDFSLYGYNEFCRDIGMEPYSYPLEGTVGHSYSVGYKDVVFSSGRRVRLVALNTSLMLPFTGISEDKMWLGQAQIRSLINYGILPAPKDIWYTIALCHHSDRFLHPDETSTYNGRPATLPLLLEHVNLILCGHTESSGRPRLSKQQGGGSILCSGAAYYSDDHINAFSMIYLSDRKPTMGFLPYVYENGWHDYDFEHSVIHAGSLKLPDDEGEYLNDVRILFQSDDDSFQIDCQYLTLSQYELGGSHYVRIHNHKDVMNPFRIEYDSSLSAREAVRVTLAPTGRFSAKSNLEYKRYAAFVQKGGAACERHCRFLSSDGEELFAIHRYTAKDSCRYDSNFLREICSLEDTFNVRFRLPDTITENDLKKIRLLKKLSSLGYAENAMLSGEIRKVMQRGEMQELYQAACRDNRFCIRSRQACHIQLFDVTLDLGDVTVFATPFYIDVHDIRHKLDSFCPGDLRVCDFIPDINLNVYLTRDRTYQELMDIHNLPSHSEIQNIENIDLTIHF